MRLYIAVLDEVPDYIVPTLVAHTILNAHEAFKLDARYDRWFRDSFKKCVVSVNQKEYDKIKASSDVFEGYENKTLGGKFSCIIRIPCEDADLPNVLKFAKLWKPK